MAKNATALREALRAAYKKHAGDMHLIDLPYTAAFRKIAAEAYTEGDLDALVAVHLRATWTTLRSMARHNELPYQPC